MGQYRGVSITVAMTAMGQSRKYSPGADVFRLTLGSGRPASGHAACRMETLDFRILHSNQLFPRTQLPVDVGESRFEDITDWLPRAAVELN
jgi:hypothetical protein